ncbi:MAG: LamG domain-containing protein [Bacteroidetes bacterium]|nr:LamG domain-containing protein [Bacteroidota bacterium]
MKKIKSIFVLNMPTRQLSLSKYAFYIFFTFHFSLFTFSCLSQSCQSISFNGSSQYTYIANNPSISITGDFSLEAWINSNNTPTDEERFIAKCDGGWNGFSFILYNSSGKNYVQANYVSGTGIYTGSYCEITLTPGTWYHVAATADVSDKNIKIYINGIEQSVTNITTGATSVLNAGDLVIGRFAGSNIRFFDGLMDDVRIWNVIRTSSEITDNYDKELAGNESGLVAYYKFNNSYLDETSNNNDLTAVSSPTFSTNVPFICTPAIQASSLTFSSVQSCGLVLGWTRGDGSNCAVFMHAGITGTAAPEDGTTYTANTVFGNSGSQIGSTGWYCVYNGTETNVAVNGLTAATTYRVHVCEYNGSAGSEKYLTTSATDNPKNQATTTISYGTVGSGDQIACSSGFTPNNMSVIGASGSGSFSYQWYSQSGIVSCPSGSTIGAWTTLGSSNGANTETYTPASNITASTSYACFVTPGGSPTCSTATWASSCRQITLTAPTPATVDWNNSNVQEITLSACRSLTFINGKSGGVYKLIIKQDATGGRLVTWPSDVKWTSVDIAPTLTVTPSVVNIVKFIYDGTSYLGY